jgi:hypothetical protein
MTHEHHLQLAAFGEATAKGEFEIMAITAGVGNGWTFSPDVLQASLPLWNNVETFVDHGARAGLAAGRSLRDLGGLCHGAAWDDAVQGIRLRLRTAGPSGPLVRELAREMLAEPPAGARPRVGFSADIVFTAGSGRQVSRILRVLSLDLVFNPARGGAFIRAMNSIGALEPALPGAGDRQENEMDENGNYPAAAAEPAAAEEARQVRAQMCTYLLDSGLAASRLPAASQDFVRQQFAGRVFETAELTAALDAQRRLVAALTGGAVVQGPGRLQGMVSTSDQLQAAVDDLLGAPRESQAVNLQVHRLTGIRELYHTLTGDYDMHGGYYADRVQLATTADFAGLVKNALNKIVAEKWEQLGRAGYDWWRPIVTVEHMTTLNAVTGILVGTVGALPTVAEGAEYTELAIGDSPETASFTKYGGYIPLTLELLDRDDHRKLAAYPHELAAAGIRRISALIAAVFTDNSGVGPALADGGALFNNTAVTTAGGHKNLLTTALSAAEWEVVSTAVFNQPLLVKNAAGYYGTGSKLGINPRFLLVPRALQLTAREIIYPTLKNAANIYSQNLQRGEPGDVITVPDWTDADNWAAAVDPALAPSIILAERFGLLPEIFVAGDGLSPAVFMNDEHRLKVRHFNAVLVADFRPLHKSNV